MKFQDNVGAQLARLERALKTVTPIDANAWYEWLDVVVGSEEDDRLRGWATRLADLVIEQMNEEEYAEWGLTHGWVDDDGNWHCPHPRENSIDDCN